MYWVPGIAAVIACLTPGWGYLLDPPFMHHSLRPLDEADLGVDARQLDMFGEECSGICGV